MYMHLYTVQGPGYTSDGRRRSVARAFLRTSAGSQPFTHLEVSGVSLTGALELLGEISIHGCDDCVVGLMCMYYMVPKTIQLLESGRVSVANMELKLPLVARRQRAADRSLCDLLAAVTSFRVVAQSSSARVRFGTSCTLEWFAGRRGKRGREHYRGLRGQ